MPPHVQMLHLRIDPHRQEEFDALMAVEAPRTRAFDGCQRFEIYGNDQGEVIFLEHWESEAKSKAYGQWRAARGDFETLGAFFTAPPVTSVYRLELR